MQHGGGVRERGIQQKVKAWVLHGVDQLRFEDMEKAVPKAGEALVSVRAAGVCGSDIPRIYRTGTHKFPLIPGHEFSGEVAALGEGTDSRWLGERVGIFPLIPCGKCGPCRKRQYEMCRDYSYLGSRRDGGFAEYVTVPQWNLIRLPKQVSFEEAAMLEPMAVAVHAMKRGLGGRMGEDKKTAAVCGLGTIGLLLLMFLKEAGVEKVFVMGNKDFQRNAARKLGVGERDYCDIRKEYGPSWLMERTQGQGVDIFFECVGKNETCSLAVDAAAAGGSVVLVGNPCSNMLFEKDVYWKILRNQLHVTGTWNSSFSHEAEDDWNYSLTRLAGKRIDPAGIISHRYSLDQLHRGLEIMRDKTEDYGKVMIV